MTEAKRALSDEERAARRAKRERWQGKIERGKRRERNLRRAMFWLKLLRAPVRWMPMPLACATGHALGALAWSVARASRREALEHLAIAFPEMTASQRRRIGRRSFALLGRGLFAFFVAHREGSARALSRVTVDEETAAPARAELAKGTGFLLLTFHFGAFELLASWIGNNLRAKAVGRPGEEGGPTRVLIDMRRELGCETIERGDPREILRVIKGGGAVAMLIDQDTDDVNGVFVPYFGRLAHTPPGPAALAVRLKVPVVMGFIEWTSLTRHRVFALPPQWPREDLPAADAALELTSRLTKLGEDVVRRRPDHWVWMHRRWQTRPEQHPDRAVYAPGP